MDIQALSDQQQHDILASLFPGDDAHNPDNYQAAMNNHPGGRNPSPASSSSSGLHDAHSGPSIMDQSNNRRNSPVNHNGASGNNMFPPSSPIQPQSPHSQITVQLLGSLMQMQGLDVNFPVSSAHLNSGYSSATGGTSNSTLGTYPSYPSPMNMGNMARNNAGNAHNNMDHSPRINGGNPAFGDSGPNGHSASTTVLLEQQIKLQQLQQLQQLQNQIFQQQIAIISGQPPPASPNGEFRQSQQQQNAHSNNSTSPSFTGLATPGPSNELRPQQPQLDFDHFSQPLPSPMSSHTHHNLPFPHPSDDFLHRGTSSAPEHVAFHVRTDLTPSPHFTAGTRPDHDLDISPLTSPWLGAYGGSVSHPNDTEKSRESSLRPSEQRHTSNKRGPPDDSSFSRKKHSTGISSVVEGGSVVSSSINVSNTARRPYHKGSKSTTSTPLLRGSRSRSKSGAGNTYATSPLTCASGSGHHPDAYPTPGGSVMDSSNSLPSIPGDTPSPVDLSMPPPPLPSSAPSHDPDAACKTDDRPARGSGLQLTPLTPGVVMKLGPFSNNSVPTPSTRSSRTKSKSEPNGRSSKAAQSAHGLKHILPAGGGGTNLSNAGPSVSEAPGPAKKVSHKDAEQKRRDSQKTAYDDLRRLLPPITFEDEDEQGGQTVISKKKDEVIPVRGPLPPGALPPRGPPKAGGEGPNKGVSKLQLLICGNQYIRTLKGRVERRDGEIAKLRREVGRLRRKTESLESRLERVHISGAADMDGGMDVDLVDGEGEDEEEEAVDLERDLDAIEGMGVHIGLVGEYDDEGED